MTMRLSRLNVPAAIACAGAFWLGTPQLALAQTESDSTSVSNATTQAAAQLPQQTKVEMAAAQARDILPGGAAAPGAAATVAPAPSAIIIGNGSAVKLDQLGISITPPLGWEVETNTGSLSLVMREPKVTAPDYEKPKFQRNVTVAAIQHPSPIDEKRAAELEGELSKQFSQDGSVGNFKVVEHKFFNYKGANDGLIVYSSMTLGEYSMMQMHVLVSGQERQFLLTYTDLANRFSDAKDGNFEKAWNSIVSIEVTGPSPSRQNDIVRYGTLVGGLALLGLIGFLFSRRLKRTDYAGDDDGFADDGGAGVTTSMIATLAGTWRLGGKGEVANEGLDFTGDAAPITRQTEYVSSY